MENVYLCNRFRNLVQPFETKNTKVVTTALKDYRFCGGGLYIHTKFVGEYAKVDFIDVNGKPVKSI